VTVTDLPELLSAPTETLDSEIKGWLDLAQEDQRAKVAKVLLSLFNQGGGSLIFGFDDKTRLPLEDGRPANVAQA
jgi:hypothetical protein